MTIEAIKAAFEMTRGALSRLLMARISAVGSAGLCSLLALQLGCSQHLNSLGLLGEWDGEKGFGRGCSQHLSSLQSSLGEWDGGKGVWERLPPVLCVSQPGEEGRALTW